MVNRWLFLKTKIRVCSNLLFFLAVFLNSADSFSWEKAYGFSFCEKKVLTSHPDTTLINFLPEFELFEKNCSLDCKRKITGIISGWASLNGFSQKKEIMCLFGGQRPEQAEEYSVAIFFPERKGILFSGKAPPIDRYDSEKSIFGPTFFFNSKECKFISVKGSYGPDKKNIYCPELEISDSIILEKEVFKEYFDNWTLVTMIFNKDGKVEKWRRGTFFKDIDSQIDFDKEKKIFSFLEKFTIHFPKKIRPLITEGYPFEFFLSFENDQEKNLIIKITQECINKRWDTIYVVDRNIDGKWKKMPYIEIGDE